MPIVAGKEFPYTKKGIASAKKSAQKKGVGLRMKGQNAMTTSDGYLVSKKYKKMIG